MNSPLLVSFPPIVNQQSRVLILGSMPGEKSLQQQEYYAHPRNSFWKIMGELFHFPYDLSYPNRIQALLKSKIALWDVLKSCKRKGSLDSSIQKESTYENDFETFFKTYTHIQNIYCNGTTAYQYFKKYLKHSQDPSLQQLRLHLLPSTSPAHAAVTVQQKKFAWSIIQKALSP